MDEPKMPIDEARRILHDEEVNHSIPKCVAAFTLMHALESCENDLSITFGDMLRCLDYGGMIAEIGARCLYVRTGRDGLRWDNAGSNGLPYIVSRVDWEAYLRRNDFI